MSTVQLSDGALVDAGLPAATPEVELAKIHRDDFRLHLNNDRGKTIGHTTQRLMAEGVLDVVSIPALMKKNRPAHVLKVLARPEDADRLQRILFNPNS